MTNKKYLNKIVDKAISASFKKDKLNSQVVTRFVKNFKNMHLSESIYTLSKYVKGLKRVLSEKTLIIESVIPVSSQDVNKIKSKISRLFTVTQTQVTINPSLLGGLRIKVGDTVLDYSVRSKLNQIGEAIING